MSLSPANDDEIHRRGLREQVYDSVLRMLLDGRVEAGERLSIEEVARRLNVSPTPVREAFVMLERTGLVSRVALRGYRVAPPLDERQLSELFDARLLLEEAAARRAHEHRVALKAELESITAQHDDHAAQIIEYGAESSIPIEITQAYFTTDAAFHNAIFTRAGNRYLADMYDSLGALTHRMRQTVTRGPEDVREASLEHHAIVEAYASDDPEAAARAMRTHIMNVRGRSLARDDE
ncbi:DNA-binding GntR family transcriptional regulator [Microbacterium trichothecenolyticum]|uniref:GntR family transcriptional regulator n=1 Tax=Microbacterium trichothecenolyticum TaxID=69370 RepID=UPI0028577F99|nr:GntR family transcriptional regulator [Microbacterium trichothecenolyticum]MDR7187128.1 DNA-binding GntR family transcriptional regulator [Microbacterium trichothecenolyticum]